MSTWNARRLIRKPKFTALGHYQESILPANVRHGMLYQAIKMSRADGECEYHEDERAAVARAAQILGVERNIITELESIAELEDATDRLRFALLGTEG